MKRTLALTTLLLAIASVALADVAEPGRTPRGRTPKPKPAVATDLMIRLDADARDARLIIPKSQLKQLRAELEQIDDDGNIAAAAAGTDSLSRTQVIASGMFLSLAIAFGGVWFMRSGRSPNRAVKTAIIAAAGLGIASASTIAFANIGPPSLVRGITGTIFSTDMQQRGTAWGKIKVETSDEDHVELVVPHPKSSPANQ